MSISLSGFSAWRENSKIASREPSEFAESCRLSSDKPLRGAPFAMFEGVYEWLKLFFTHANTLSSLAPTIHGMHNVAQDLNAATPSTTSCPLSAELTT
jgi:hypothetical protein